MSSDIKNSEKTLLRNCTDLIAATKLMLILMPYQQAQTHLAGTECS